jgi:hypothetical protein
MRKTMRAPMLAFFVIASFLLSQTTAIAQTYTCQGVGGQWVDNYNYNWNLSQSGNYFSGTVVVECATWSASGSSTISGHTIDASGPTCVASSFRYVGSNNQPGCETGSGTWTNNLGGSGDWNWSKPCDKPSTETTNDYGWNGTYHDFRANLSTSGGLAWGGSEVDPILWTEKQVR